MICSVLYDVDTITINVDNDVFLKSQSNYPQKPAFYKYSCLMHFVILCSTEIIERSDIYYKKEAYLYVCYNIYGYHKVPSTDRNISVTCTYLFQKRPFGNF